MRFLGVTTNPLLTFPGGIQIGANVNVPQATSERKFQFQRRLLLAGGQPQHEVWNELHQH